MSEFLRVADGAASADMSVIRQARLAKGLSLETLASVLKVTPAKLDALESGRFKELPDLAFARALAKTVCRYLELDPVMGMASLPSAQPVSLSSSEHKGVPFKASKARLNLDVGGGMPFKLVLKAQWLAPLGILLAAVLVYVMPAHHPWLQPLLDRFASTNAPEVVASQVSVAAAMPVELLQKNASAVEVASSEAQESVGEPAAPMASVPPVPLVPALVAASSTVLPPPGADGAAAATASGAVELSVSDGAWIEVKDATGGKVLHRHLNTGERAVLDGQAPFSLKIGNAAAVKLSYKGQPVELAAFTRNNVARLELK